LAWRAEHRVAMPQRRRVTQIPLPIEGKKTTLRRMSVEDLPEWYALEAHPDVKRYIRGPEPRPRDEWIEKACDLVPHLKEFAVIAKDSGRFAGRASLTPYNEHGEWEIIVLIAKDQWGSGLGRDVTEALIQTAFCRMKVRAVVGVIHPENAASRRLVCKLGFECTGINSSDGWQKGHIIYRLPNSVH
jgi:[ribosomal protein S5]-alanine N-acetyltransferase